MKDLAMFWILTHDDEVDETIFWGLALLLAPVVIPIAIVIGIVVYIVNRIKDRR